jgi:hypothetical protein
LKGRISMYVLSLALTENACFEQWRNRYVPRARVTSNRALFLRPRGGKNPKTVPVGPM